jgi:hypothetical protein
MDSDVLVWIPRKEKKVESINETNEAMKGSSHATSVSQPSVAASMPQPPNEQRASRPSDPRLAQANAKSAKVGCAVKGSIS